MPKRRLHTIRVDMSKWVMHPVRMRWDQPAPELQKAPRAHTLEEREQILASMLRRRAKTSAVKGSAPTRKARKRPRR